MKILLVNNFGVPEAGAEVMVLQLKENLLRQGHDVRVLAGHEPSSSQKFSDYTFRSFRDDSIGRFFFFIFNPSAVWSLYKILKTFKPDVVHLHNVSKASPFILWPLKKFPTVLTLHDYMLIDPTHIEKTPTLQQHKKTLSYYFKNDRTTLRYYGEKVRFFFFKHFYKNIDVTISPSNFYANVAREINVFRNVIVVHNGIEALPFSSLPDNKNVCFLGRIDRVKGLDILLQAMPEVLRQIPDATLTVAGDGVLKEYCEELSRDLGVGESVRFLGHLAYEPTMQVLTDASILIVPSIFPDNLPTTCIEAMFIGRPIIASQIGGIPEMVAHEKTGLLVKPSDPEGLARAVITLLRDPHACIEFGTMGRVHAEKKFSVEEYINKTLGIYESLLKI